MLLDLHCHSKYSRDAITAPRHIAETAKRKGIVVALTDHDNAQGWKSYSSECKRVGTDFILGQEQKVYWGNKFAGELLFLFLRDEIKSAQVLEAIDEAKVQGALVSVAHPFDRFRKMPNGKFKRIEEIVGKIDAIEVFNARCLSDKPNKMAKEFAEKNRLGFTAGSDAHFPKEIGKAFVEAEANSLEEARALIKKGKVKIRGALSSPIVHFETKLVRIGLIRKERD